MEFDEKDTELINVLAMVKSADSEYPEDLLTSRRQQFMKQLAEIGAISGLGIGLKSSSSGGSAIPPIASSLVETALVIAIVAEAGVVAFINRDKLTEIFRTVSKEPNVQQVSTPVNPVLMPVELELTSTSYWTPTIHVTDTPSPVLSPTVDPQDTTVAGTTPQVTATPDPKNNNGNHYGQTPKPERTKENGNNNPKDPKKTKAPKDPKPTKKPKK